MILCLPHWGFPSIHTFLVHVNCAQHFYSHILLGQSDQLSDREPGNAHPGGGGGAGPGRQGGGGQRQARQEQALGATEYIIRSERRKNERENEKDI